MAQKERRAQAADAEIEAVDEAELIEEAEADDDERGLTAGKGRVTPGRRTAEEEEHKGNFLTRIGRGLRHYFDGVRGELKKVAWPTREDTRRLTLIVIGTLIASALILGAIGLVFTELFRIGLSSPLVLLAFMVIAVGGGLIFNRVNSRRSNN